MKKIGIASIFIVMFAQSALAELKIQIFSAQQITQRVDRFKDIEGNAFATIFCSPDAAQVMIVDAKMTDLDGKIFHFDSQDSCERARVRARFVDNECHAFLKIDVNTMGAASEAVCPKVEGL
jgi:hypothetical protein